jgi:anhydro-N-acetylmuramic acid kinase
MNQNIIRLHRLAGKKSRLIVGLMSGTSLDGLDIALCRISGHGMNTHVVLQKFHTIPYKTAFRKKVLEIFARRTIDFQTLCELNASIGTIHGQMVLQSLRKWKISSSRIDAIASHGQTVFHSPKSITPGATINSTLQIGDGDHVAVASGIITLSDFRQKHIAAGGEGAPLAVYGDYLLYSKRGEDRIMLNMGGIGNFTYLPASAKASEVFVTDTGPANTLIDQAVRMYRPDLSYDKDARLAKNGIYHPKLLEALKADPFFALPFPKTIGPEIFNLEYVKKAQQATGTTSIKVEDLLATLTRLSAETIAGALKKVVRKKTSYRIFASGGGAHNPLMMQWIKELLPAAQFNLMEELGISGDAKEAVLFAVLANEALAGGRLKFGNRSKVPSVSMGKISFPL